MNRYQAVVIGCSAGGLKALKTILPLLPELFPIPIIIVQHIPKGSNDSMIEMFDAISKPTVKEADNGDHPAADHIYFAPPDYHLLISESGELVLSADAPVLFSRPSIDELFISAAEFYTNTLIGIILTGANEDGAAGLQQIQAHGGISIVQTPDSAEVDTMPKAALDKTDVDHILNLEEIPFKVIELLRNGTTA